MKTSDQTILITGASSGIGHVLSRHLASEGNRIIACGRNADRLSELAATSPTTESCICDLQDVAAVGDLASRFGGDVDILINCAGISQELSLIEEPDINAQIAEIEVNLVGTIRMVDAFLPHLLKRLL